MPSNSRGENFKTEGAKKRGLVRLKRQRRGEGRLESQGMT